MSEIKKFLNDKNISYKQLIELYLNNSPIIDCKEFYMIDNNFYFLICSNSSEDYAILFKQTFKLKLIRAKGTIYERNNILCSLEIMDLIDELKMQEKYIFFDENGKKNFENNICDTDRYIKDGVLILYELYLEIPEIIRKDKLKPDLSYYPSELSEYFFDYFPYENKNINKKIKCLFSAERENLFKDLSKLYVNKEMRKYKMTGPTSNGKSFSLFFYSRISPKVIYINLKILKNKDKNTAIKIIISEFSRLYLEDAQIKSINEEVKKLNLQNDIIKILLELITIILKLNISKLVLILDQFKRENYQSYPNFREEIKLLMEKYSQFKIVYCSSINDNEMRDDALDSFEKTEGKHIYNAQTQEYIFYYAELYKKKESDNDTINYLFGNKKKYISFFYNPKRKKDEIFKEISKRIQKKIESFRVSKMKNQEISSNYSFNDVLIYIKSIFNLKFDYENLFNVLRACPLKYIKIIFNTDHFIVKPVFPFINNYIYQTINKDECDNFFKKKKYNLYSFLTHRLKAEYFEYSVQTALKTNDVFAMPNEEKREITLYEIIKMNQISESNYDLMKDFNLKEKEDNEDYEDDNESIINTINNMTFSDKAKEKSEKENEEYVKNLLEKFNDKNESNIDIKQEQSISDYEKDLSDNIKKRFKAIDAYRKEALEKYKDYKNNEKEINVLIEEVKKQKLKEFSGNENIFLDQQKENGECLDYAILFGKRDNKILVSFQMKCFGRKSQINVNALNKTYIKEKMKNILINSMAFFNCKITKWYYYLIFYYNKNDIEDNNISTKFLHKVYDLDVEIIFYNPEEHTFYDSVDGEIIEFKLTQKADLDYNNNYIFNRVNFKYDDNKNEYNREAIYYECIQRFIQDLNFLDNTKQYSLENILNKINEIVEKDGLNFETCLDFKNGIIDYPKKNKVFIYKNKKNNFIAITHKNDHIIEEKPIFHYYNLNTEKKLKTLSKDNLSIGYYYCLSLKNIMRPGKPKRNRKSVFNNAQVPKHCEKFIPLK